MRFNRQGGFVQFIVIVVVLILVVSYFGFSVRDFLDNPQTQDNFSVVWGLVVQVWHDYLEAPARWVWDNIISFIWNDLFLDNLHRLQGGENFSDLAPPTPTVGN